MTVQISFKRNDWVFHTGPCQMSGHSDLGILKIILEHLPFSPGKANTASAACPAHPGSLEMISMTFAAVICDADDPCSVEYCIRSRIIFHNIASEYNSTPAFSVPCLQFSIFQMTCPSVRRNELFAPFVLASSITSFLLLTFVKFPRRNFLLCFPIPYPLLLLLREFSWAWGIGINLWTKFVMLQWIVSFSCKIWSSWWAGNDSPMRSLVDSLSFQNTRKFCFDFIGCTTPTILIALDNFAGHSRSHGCFQFLMSILDGLLEFLVLRVDEHRYLAIFVRYRDGAFHVTTIASPSAWHSFPLCPRVLATNDLAWISAVFVVITGPQKSVWRFFFQWNKLSETCPRIRQVSWPIDIPVIIDAFLLLDIQIRMSSSGYINVFSVE